MPNKTAQELFAEAKSRITEISAADAIKRKASGAPVTFLDVRDTPEVNLGKVAGAVHISRGTLESKIEAAVPRDADVIVYCASGNRSALAAETMKQMGYEKVASLAGGFRAWAENGGDVE